MSTASNFISIINQNYPISGQDNSSQGFRNNFKNIKQALSYLDSDIGNLQIYGLKSTQNNDFNDNLIERATFKDCALVVYDETDTTNAGDIEVDYTNGSYQKFKLSAGHHIITFVNWPDISKTGKLTLSLISDNAGGSTVEFASEIVNNFGSDKFPITIKDTTPKIFEIWNDGDEGTIYFTYLKDITDSPRSVSFKSSAQTTTTSAVNDIKGMIFASSTTFYAAYDDHVSSTITNWLAISADHVAKKLPAGSTAVTVTVTNTSTAVATTEFVQNRFATYQYMPTGSIILWYGSIASIPSGWALCNGSNGTPDLRGRFIIGAGDRAQDPIPNEFNTYTTSTSIAGSHDHDGATGTSNVPNTVWPQSGTAPGDPDDGKLLVGSGLDEAGEVLQSVAVTTGAGGNHDHTINTDGSHQHTYLPPYHALCYIMKL